MDKVGGGQKFPKMCGHPLGMVPYVNFGGCFYIIWLNGSAFMLRCSRTSVVDKTGYAENGETRSGYKQGIFAIRLKFICS